MKRLFQFAVAAAMDRGLHGPKAAAAVDLSGAWATSADECSNVFVRKGRAKQIEFTTQDGGGFIVEVDRLRGKFARCKIKTEKQDGDAVNIVAGCASDIMLSNVTVQPRCGRAEQDIADLSRYRGQGDQLSPLSDVIIVAVDAGNRG